MLGSQQAAQLFEESYPDLFLTTDPEQDVYLLPTPDPVPLEVERVYTPPEVTMPHPAQKFTIFHPYPPAPEDRFPTIIFATAGAFTQGPPPPAFRLHFFLTEAITARGWAVVSVGSTGINSTVVSGQLPRCHPNPRMTNPPPCWDYSMWYAPDDDEASPWNDFDYFMGEKDFLWARQYVAEHAAELNVDNSRVILTGVSSGAHYAAFVAYASAPWDQSNFSFALSSQVQQPTSVAGVAAFEPVSWLQAEAPSTALIPVDGYKWPLNSDPMSPDYYVRAPWIDDVDRGRIALGGFAETYLQTGSTSTWIRRDQRDVPMFIASGDGNELSTRFNRNANAPGDEADYDRSAGSDPPNSPVMAFEDDPALVLHDFWFPIMLMEDLLLTNSDFHDRHSRLYLRDDPANDPVPVEWERLPARFSTTGSPPVSASEVTILDGTFLANCDGLGGPLSGCSSIANADLAPIAMDWADCEFCVEDCPITGVHCRNVPPNFNSYRVSNPVAGDTMVVEVDFSALDSRYDHGYAFAYADVGGSSRVEAPLGNGSVLLCTDSLGSGYWFVFGFTQPSGTGLVQWTAALPPGALGQGVCSQALVADLVANPMGAPKAIWRLTNAQDFTVF